MSQCSQTDQLKASQSPELPPTGQTLALEMQKSDSDSRSYWARYQESKSGPPTPE